MRYGVLFPAFGTPYLGVEQETLQELSAGLEDLALQAATVVEFELETFFATVDGAFGDDLQSQYAVYVYSCALSNVLRRHRVPTHLAAGFSMGLYAALYHVGSVSFADGLRLIEEAHRVAHLAVGTSEYGMGMATGLSEDAMRGLAADISEVELTGINNPYSYILSGTRQGIGAALSVAREQGALSATPVPTRLPYHSSFMSAAALAYAGFVDQVELAAPHHPIVSCLVPRLVVSRDDVRQELCQNMATPMNWFATVSLMAEADVQEFIECGPGKSLTKNNRFLPGKHKTTNVAKLSQLLGVRERADDQAVDAEGAVARPWVSHN